MSEVKIVIEILREVGLPALIIVVLLYLCLKTEIGRASCRERV